MCQQMKYRKTAQKMLLRFVAVVSLLAAMQSGVCQSVTQLKIPRYLCFGDSVFVTFGTDTSNTVVIETRDVSRGQNDRVFLPDGVPCGDMGCSYVSSVVYDEFVQGATVSSVNDIKYLRINLEHSYMGDLYIRVVCPNNQDATVLRFGGLATTSCASSIPSNERSWLSGQNVSASTHLGRSNNDQNNEYKCDSSAVGNEPGTGWNYCWSNNVVSGYTYASGDGILYRYGHSHGSSIDSSYVDHHYRFYHPDESFSSLIGCPLNGQWSVVVVDGYGADNGYVFSWEMVMDASLTRDAQCIFDSFAIQGYGAEKVDYNSFFISIPWREGRADTTVRYRFYAYDTCGRVLDTFAFVTFKSPSHTWVHRECVENSLPYTFLGVAFDDSVSDYQYHYQNAIGCDSIVHFGLTVWRNNLYFHDTVVCSTSLPLEWNGFTFGQADTVYSYLLDMHGSDSVIGYVVIVDHPDTTDVYARVCNGKPFTWIDGVTYYDASESPCFVIATDGLCDSVLHLKLNISDNPYVANITVSPNPVTSDNTTVTLRDKSLSVSREWSYCDRVDTSRNTSFVYPFPSDSVAVFFSARDSYGCADSLTVMVYGDWSNLWLPNAFTPSEQSNRLFLVKTSQISKGMVYIYTRAGNLVTSFDALTGSWDGTKDGTPCPQGTYVWKMNYVTKWEPSIEKIKIGTVTLIR